MINEREMQRERGERIVDRYVDRQLRGLLGERAVDATTWRDLRQFEAAALAVIEQIWRLDARPDADYWHLLIPPGCADQACADRALADAALAVEQLLGSEAGNTSAALLLHPQLWNPPYTAVRAGIGGPPQFARGRLLVQIAEQVVARVPPVDFDARLAGRLLTLCAATGAEGYPDFATCLSWLARAAPTSYQRLLAYAAQDAWTDLALDLAYLAGSAAAIDLALLRAQWQLALGNATAR